MLKKNYKNDFKSLGNEGEEFAANFLAEKGYKIIERNFRAYCGEIDIIAKYKNEIIFVEVKTRRNMKYGEAIDSITPLKKVHILKTANYFLYKNNLLRVPIRFDIIEVYLFDKNFNINHIKNVSLN